MTCWSRKKHLGSLPEALKVESWDLSGRPLLLEDIIVIWETHEWSFWFKRAISSLILNIALRYVNWARLGGPQAWPEESPKTQALFSSKGPWYGLGQIFWGPASLGPILDNTGSAYSSTYKICFDGFLIIKPIIQRSHYLGRSSEPSLQLYIGRFGGFDQSPTKSGYPSNFLSYNMIINFVFLCS